MKATSDRFAALAAIVPAAGKAREQFDRLCSDLDACRKRNRRLEDGVARQRMVEDPSPAQRDQLDRHELGRQLDECRTQLRNVLAANVALVKAARPDAEQSTQHGTRPK